MFNRTVLWGVVIVVGGVFLWHWWMTRKNLTAASSAALPAYANF